MSGFEWSAQRLLTLAFAVLTIQVFLLEPSTHTHHVAPIVPRSDYFDGSLTSIAVNASPGRHSDLIVLAESFEGSRVFMSDVPPDQRWSRSRLGGIGRVAAVGTGVQADSPIPPDSASVKLSGTSRRGDWTILAADLGARDFAYVSISQTEYAYVDHVLISREGVLQRDAVVFGSASDYGRFLVSLREWGLFSALLAVGLVLLRGTRLEPWVLPWAAFPTGLAAVAAMGVFRPRGVFGFGLVVLLAVLLTLARMVMGERATLRSAAGVDGCDQNQLLLAFVAVGITSGAARRFRLYEIVGDSFDYLSGAYALGLASGPLTSESLDTSFYIGQQAIHAAGYALGVGPLFAMGWALLVCIAGMLAGLVRNSWFADAVGDRALAAFLIIGIAVGSPYVWRFAAYMNSHMFVAALLLLLLLVFSDPAQGSAHEFGLGLLIFSALIFTRGEAPLVIALVLLGFTASNVRDGTSRAANLWFALAIPNFAWAALVTSLSGGLAGAPRSVVLSVALGSAAILAGLLARYTWVARRVGGLWVVPWVGLAVAHVSIFPEGLTEHLQRLRGNMLSLHSSAGILPLLLVLLGVALVARAPSSDTPHLSGMRTLALGYLPAIVLARAGSRTAWSAGGITEVEFGSIIKSGFFDSTNRILFHLWFVLIAAFLMAPSGGEPDRNTSRGSRVTALVAFGVLAQQWTTHLPWTDPQRWSGWALIALFAAVFLQRSTGSLRTRWADRLRLASGSQGIASNH